MKEKPQLNEIMDIPKGFQQMDEEMILKYYFITDQQPDIAFICDENVFLSLKLNNQGFTKEQLEEYKTNVFDAVFSKGTANYQSELKPDLNQIHYSFETQPKTPDPTNTSKTDETTIPEPPPSPHYVKAIAALHQNRLLNVNFTCPAAKKKHWESIISKAFSSLKNE